MIWEKGSSKLAGQIAPEGSRYKSCSSASPLKISLFPMILDSLQRRSTLLFKSSSIVGLEPERFRSS